MKRFEKPNLKLEHSKKYEIYGLDDDMNIVKNKNFGIKDGFDTILLLKSLYSKMPHRSYHAKEINQ
jgi:hypothetical protein